MAPASQLSALVGEPLIIWDFDRTIMDDDSDRWVVVEMGLTQLFNQLRQTLPWNSLMDRMMEELHSQGKTIQDITTCLNRVVLNPHIVSAIKAAHAHGCDLKVLSDANQFFIETILKNHGIYDCFSGVITNPTSVDEEGRLRIFPYHGSALPPHGCDRCPPNLCKHVEAWTVRLMWIRQANLLKNPGSKLRWTVLTPDFYEYMKDDKSNAALDFAGSKDPYPPFWEVDYVYLPLRIGQSDWLLVRINMHTLVITHYWTDKRWRNEKRGQVSYYTEIVTIFFKWFLERIHYWRNTKYHAEYDLSVGLVDLDVPQDDGNIANTGVIVCMMMENLVKNRSLKIDNDVEGACVKYRRRMADELYKWRYSFCPVRS